MTGSEARGRRWPHLEAADVLEDRRVLELARLLVRRGFLPRAEASLFLVFSAAVHARRRGRAPAALFAFVLRRPHLITEAEDAEGQLRARQAPGRALQACRADRPPEGLEGPLVRVLEAVASRAGGGRAA